jgi:putative membrane-bound dehydrogenase-like protein
MTPKIKIIQRLCFLFCVFFYSSNLFAFDAPLPEGVKNDQDEADQTISPSESLKLIQVPEGFKVTLFAGEPDLSQPIAFTFDDRGRLWVVQNFSHPHFKKVGHDRVLIFEDTDGDGEFDSRKVFWDKGEYVTGIQVGHGGVWLCNSPELQFIPDRDGDDVPDGDAITILDGWNIQGKNNVFNNLNWGPDGWLYGCIGQNGKSLIGQPDSSESDRVFMSRGIWRYHPARKKIEVVARGAVNPWGLDFDDYGEGFFTNCVLPHAWHLIPGAYYERRSNETDFPDIYGRIPPIADHLHWAGGHWTSSRSGKGVKEALAHTDHGGGHAHTGCMIYMGGNWPEKYRGTLLVGNIHGNRINNDILSRLGSSYVASHGKDFLMGHHAWFRSLSQKYGHDGAVYISDWHDYGECHDNDGTHRSSGRIYKVSYGELKPVRIDLSKASEEQLVEYQIHENEWYSRHARRILQERSIAGKDMKVVHENLKQMLKTQTSVPKKLRAMWCLHSTAGFSEAELIELLSHEHESLRAWSIRFLLEKQHASNQLVEKLREVAKKEASALVRLHLASCLQRLPAEQAAGILLDLSQRGQDREDRMIPKMLYYAGMKLVEAQNPAIDEILNLSKIPLLTEYLARCQITRFPETLPSVIEMATSSKSSLALIQGVYESLLRVGEVKQPENWDKIYKSLLSLDDEELSLQATLLALKFKDPTANDTLEKMVLSNPATDQVRKQALEALVKAQGENLLSVLLECLKDAVLRLQAIQALATQNDESIVIHLLENYSKFNTLEREAFFTTMSSREKLALKLFETIDEGKLSAQHLNSFHHRQMQAFKSEELNRYLVKYWGEAQPGAKNVEREIAKYKKMLSPRFLSEADPKNGKLVYQRMCAACHKLFGEGGEIGPDLTGSGRKDTHYLLENIIDPSRIVSKHYQLATIILKDQRIITGTIVEENNQTVTVSSLNENIILEKEIIESLERSKKSMMPEGMLNSLDRNQLRDLVGYLQQ